MLRLSSSSRSFALVQADKLTLKYSDCLQAGGHLSKQITSSINNLFVSASERRDEQEQHSLFSSVETTSKQFHDSCLTFIS